MNKSAKAFLLVGPLALLLACGAVHAQFKTPERSQPKDPLGSGLYAPAFAPATLPATLPATPPAAQAPLSADAVVQEIANCVLAGLPADWTFAQIEVIELGRDNKQREFEAKYSYRGAADKAAPFAPCNPREPAMNVYKLNAALDVDKRDWIKATLAFSKEGKFELRYDYAKKDADSEDGKDAKKDAAKK